MNITCTPGRVPESGRVAESDQSFPNFFQRESCPPYYPFERKLNGTKTTFVHADIVARGDAQEPRGHLADVPVLGQADLIAVGRQALYNRNWALHAEVALRVQGEYESWPEQYGWWLGKRQHILAPEAKEKGTA